MIRRACAVAAATFGLAFSPAIASAQDAPQQVTGSTGAAQVGPTDAEPAVAASAPVTANAPVTIASPDSGGDASQSGG